MSPARSSSSNVFDPLSLDFWPSSADPFGVVRPLAEQCPVLTNVRVDWKETPEAHVFRADLPGVRKEAAKVEVEDGNVLVISGERAREEEEKEEAGKDEAWRWRLVERSSGRFQRRFRLPRGARLDQVHASMENGVLTVTVPKEEAKKPQVRAVEISG
ncbi:heat shock protein [Zea mays]|uniref:16.9 kDa class I heat shock protein 3 n=2 Tax=Zea mays TaxID=4577 RepID=B6TD78_MAIZE|nr:16.9 kDa class I heat shock protein 3 [Zea mays]PWZ34743.1 heat shock protein [Zea mays]